MTDRMVPVSLVARLFDLLVPTGHAALVPQVLATVDPRSDVSTMVGRLVAVLVPHEAETHVAAVVAILKGEWPSRRRKPPEGTLSDREAQVLLGISRGQSNVELAAALGLVA